MKKLNKSQIWERVLTNINTLNISAEDKEDVLDALIFLQPSANTSTKVNNKGEVWCNYFKKYMDADNFNTKLSKPNKQTGERKEVYKANCKLAETILRTIKNRKNAATKQITEAFMTKHIKADRFTELLNNIDSITNETYNKAEDVPSVAELVGLTELMSTGTDKPKRSK